MSELAQGGIVPGKPGDRIWAEPESAIEDHARDALTTAGIIGVQQDTAVSNLVGMTEGWAPAKEDHPLHT